MADVPSKACEKPVRPQNRHLRPWTKETRPTKPGPGRPKRADIIEALKETYLDRPENMKRLIKTAEKKHSDMIFHYLGGKPVERIDLSGELKHTVDPSIVAAAQVAIGKL